MPQRTLRMKLEDVAVEATVISNSGKATMGGAATGVVGWLASVNWIGVSGILIALAGLIVNVYFQVRKDRRETAESRERVKALRARCGSAE
ncbi:holin [Allopusillimonas ginsengisoli]|nr:holin [Allopusillimonas ginsengisoli]